MSKLKVVFSNYNERIELWNGSHIMATLNEEEFADFMRQVSAFISKNSPEEAKKDEAKYKRQARIIHNRGKIKSMVAMINPFKR